MLQGRATVLRLAMKVSRSPTWILASISAFVFLLPVCSGNNLIYRHGYVVKINYSPLKPEEKPLRCTGAIYNERWILTSARCALYSWGRKNGKPTHAMADLVFGEDLPPTTCLPEDVTLHHWAADVALPPGLNETIDQGKPEDLNDIALLKSQKPIEFTKHFKPIHVPTDPTECAPKDGFFVGWGVTGKSANEDQWTNELRRIDIQQLGEDDCKTTSPDFNPEKMICTKTMKKSAKESTCQADTGGPFVKMADVKLPQAPVAKKLPVICGVLPISLCDSSWTDLDQSNKIEFYIAVVNRRDWIKSVAGSQGEF